MKFIVPLGPQGLRDRVRPEPLTHAMFSGPVFDVLRNTMVISLNENLRAAFSVAQATHGTDEDIDIAECYALDVPMGLLRLDVIDAVVKAYVGAGWTYSQYLNGRIILARVEIMIQKGSPPAFGIPSFVSAFPGVVSGAQSSSPHQVAVPAA